MENNSQNIFLTSDVLNIFQIQILFKNKLFLCCVMQKMSKLYQKWENQIKYRDALFYTFAFIVQKYKYLIICLQLYWENLRIASENGQKSRIYIVKGAKTWSSLTDCSSNQKFKAINCISFLSTTPTFKWSFTGPNNSLIQMIMIQKQLQLQHILSLNCSNIVREATKKMAKNFTHVVYYLQK